MQGSDGHDTLLYIGVFSTFAGLVLKEVLSFLKSRNGHDKEEKQVAKGLRVNPADFSVEWDEMLDIMRELRRNARRFERHHMGDES